MMQKLHFSVTIKAPKEKVWGTMLQDATYREWAAIFMPGSHFVGSWDKDSKIMFVAADEKGSLTGMTSKIVENIPYEHISIQHLGLVSNGVEDVTSPAAKEWVGFENYTFRETDDETEVLVDLDGKDDFAEYLGEAWPKALQKLKELAEK